MANNLLLDKLLGEKKRLEKKLRSFYLKNFIFTQKRNHDKNLTLTTIFTV